MSVNWNNLSTAQQTRFLQEAGLDRLPEPTSLNPGQIRVLAGIVGQETIASVIQGIRPDSVASPSLAAAPLVGNLEAIMARIAELGDKTGALAQASAESLAAISTAAAGKNEANSQRLLKNFMAVLEKLPVLLKMFGGDKDIDASQLAKLLGAGTPSSVGNKSEEDRLIEIKMGVALALYFGALLSIAVAAVGGIVGAVNSLIEGDIGSFVLYGLLAAGGIAFFATLDFSDKKSVNELIGKISVVLSNVLVDGAIAVGKVLETVGTVLRKVMENVLSEIGVFLRDDSTTAMEYALVLIRYLVEQKIISSEQSLVLSDIASSLIKILGNLLAPPGTSGEDIARATAGALLGMKVPGHEADAPNPEFEENIQRWLPKLQLAFEEPSPFDSVADRINGSIAGLGEKLKGMAAPHQNIMMNRGM